MKLWEKIHKKMALPTYVRIPRGMLFFLALSICALWGLAAVAWNGIFRILSVFLLMISAGWSFFVYRFWKIYYAPMALFAVLGLGAGCIILLKCIWGG